jgi:hypothetical protein
MGAEGAGRPPTQRVRTGMSPRLSALAIGALLVALAGAGLTTRQPPKPAPTSPDPAVGVLPPPRATNTPVPSTSHPPPTPRPTLTPRPTPFVMPDPPADGASELAAHVTLGSQHFVGFLTETARGQLYGAVRFDFPRPARVGTLRLLQFAAGSDDYAQLGAFRLPLDPLIPETRRSGTVIEQDVTPQPDPDAPSILREGYRLVVRAEGRESFALLRINIVIGAQSAVRP